MKVILKVLKLIWSFFYVKDIKKELTKGMEQGAKMRRRK